MLLLILTALGRRAKGLALLLSAGALAAAEPGSLAPQNASLDQRDMIFVDVRSTLEWDALRIPGAKTLPPGAVNEGNLLDLRARDTTKPALVFYAAKGGDTDASATARKAMEMGFGGIYVLEGGFKSWSKRYPDRTLFFGVPLDSQQAKDKQLDEDALNKLAIPPAAFIEAAKSGRFQILDIRQASQRVEVPLPGQPVRLTPDDFLWQITNSNLIRPKFVLVADYDGTLTGLLHYYLSRYGVTDYLFLRGGQVSLVEDPTRAARSGSQPAPAPASTAAPAAAPAASPSPVTINVPPAK